MKTYTQKAPAPNADVAVKGSRQPSPPPPASGEVPPGFVGGGRPWGIQMGCGAPGGREISGLISQPHCREIKRAPRRQRAGSRARRSRASSCGGPLGPRGPRGTRRRHWSETGEQCARGAASERRPKRKGASIMGLRKPRAALTHGRHLRSGSPRARHPTPPRGNKSAVRTTSEKGRSEGGGLGRREGGGG